MIYLGVLALLSFLILVHELGHLLAARLVGIPVAEFSIGLGPRLWKRRYGRVVYSLRALPLGGFVAPGLDEHEFSAIPLSKRVAFYLGGQITMHCLEALFPRLERLRVPLTLLGMVVLAVLMIYANVQDVSRYWL